MLLLNGLLLIIGNARLFYMARILHREAPSWIPIVGGISGTLDLLCVPSTTLNSFWWLPLLVGLGEHSRHHLHNMEPVHGESENASSLSMSLPIYR